MFSVSADTGVDKVGYRAENVIQSAAVMTRLIQCGEFGSSWWRVETAVTWLLRYSGSWSICWPVLRLITGVLVPPTPHFSDPPPLQSPRKSGPPGVTACSVLRCTPADPPLSGARRGQVTALTGPDLQRTAGKLHRPHRCSTVRWSSAEIYQQWLK